MLWRVSSVEVNLVLSLYSTYTLCTQSLWRTLHNQDDNIAQTAFRVLGKFGGSNRKMLEAPQKVCGGIEDPGLWMHYVLLRRWGIYCTLVQYSTYTVPIIKKLTFSFGRPSVLSRSSMYGRPMKRPCQRMERPHSTDNEYD